MGLYKSVYLYLDAGPFVALYICNLSNVFIYCPYSVCRHHVVFFKYNKQFDPSSPLNTLYINCHDMFLSNTTIIKCFTILENLLPQYVTCLTVH
jgi:hypothetical protein